MKRKRSTILMIALGVVILIVVVGAGTVTWLYMSTVDSIDADERTAMQRIKGFLQKRVASQPLNLPNAGSVFRNPPGDHAARLIESCGLKGLTLGGAQVSPKHANFIVNVGGATAQDIESLVNHVQGEVMAKTGITLVREVRIVGEPA